MSGNADNDLERWVPHLLRVWRAQSRSPGGPDNSLSKDELRVVSNGVRKLSLGLTRERELAGAKYMDDPGLLGAYLLFYWPVSYAQARRILTELPTRPRRVLDLGSGPGPMGFAASDALGAQVVCADRSARALAMAKNLAIESGESLGTREWTPDKAIPDGPYDAIVAGHLVNELFTSNDLAATIQKRADFVEGALRHLAPGGSLVLIEPALRETSRALLQVRDVLVERGYAVRAPCLFRGPCPALQRDSDWCHAERDWAMPRLVEDVARAAGLHKERLKMSYLLVAPRGEAWATAPSGRVFRIVSEHLHGKGRTRLMGCGPEGRLGLALQDKHLTARTERFSTLHRGDVVRLEGLETKGDGVALGADSSVEIVAHAGALVRGDSA